MSLNVSGCLTWNDQERAVHACAGDMERRREEDNGGHEPPA